MDSTLMRIGQTFACMTKRVHCYRYTSAQCAEFGHQNWLLATSGQMHRTSLGAIVRNHSLKLHKIDITCESGSRLPTARWLPPEGILATLPPPATDSPWWTVSPALWRTLEIPARSGKRSANTNSIETYHSRAF